MLTTVCGEAHGWAESRSSTFVHNPGYYAYRFRGCKDVLLKAVTVGITGRVVSTSEEGPGYVPIKAITRQLSLPYHYVSKILQQLSENEITESQCGLHSVLHI